MTSLYELQNLRTGRTSRVRIPLMFIGVILSLVIYSMYCNVVSLITVRPWTLRGSYA